MSIPHRIGKYEIRRELGKGSMGIVYEGLDPLIERPVAVKVVREDSLDPGQVPELLGRLKREAQAAGRLSHPGIVAIYDYGEDETQTGGHVAYIAMELVDGQDLKVLLDAGRVFGVDEISRMMLDVLAALQHAHQRGVTHRDIKPGNVMLLADGRAKVTDFGIARLDASDLTRTGTVIGTPQYMAPEQLLGLEVDGRTDLYACGVLLYQLLTGTKPFSGGYATIVQKVLNEYPEPPTSLRPGLGPDWDTVVRKAMAKQADDRYVDADEFAAAISAALAGTDLPAAALHLPTRTMPMARADASSTWRRAPPATAPLAAAAATAPSTATIGRRGMAIGAVLAVGAAAVAAVLMLRPAAPGGAAVGAVPPSAPASPAQVMAAASTAPAATAPVPEPTPAPVAPPVAPSAPVAVASGARPEGNATLRPATPATSLAPSAPPPVAAAAAAGPTASAPAAVAGKAVAAASQPAPVRAASAPLTPPPALAPSAEWQQRLAAVEGIGPTMHLAQALAALLDIRRREDLQRLADAEALLRRQAPQHALAMGVQDGWLVFASRARPRTDAATLLATRACLAYRAQPCRAVAVNAEFRRAAFVEVAAGLGARPVADVRRALLATLDRVLATLPSASAANTASASAPPAGPDASAGPSMPAAGMPAPAPLVTPAVEWADAYSALRARRGQWALGGALATLLHARAPDEVEVLDRFDASMKRLPWKSALALGEQNGYIVLGFAWRESKREWAADTALKACARTSTTPCHVVFADGDVVDSGLLAFAESLGAKPQAAVRQAFVRRLARAMPGSN
ncbi:serine/threonine-protein kinase [Ideonella sp. A 288]|uniref:serine/threonine-protein kinase n=1 Tax=Ideonella sp. A 288 TaxID=1962181 RepID=UPI00118536D4|nr:serine/threonine-protein kinase [Ideonella sp. A 288]